MLGALADRVDVRHAGAAPGRRRRRCRARPRRPAPTASVDVRPDAGRDDDHLAVERRAVLEREAGRRRSSPSTAVVVFSRWTCTPICSSCRCRMHRRRPRRAASPSGAASGGRRGRRGRALSSPRAASSPSSPPPMTAARRTRLRVARGCRRSRRACGRRRRPSLERAGHGTQPVDRRHERLAAGGDDQHVVRLDGAVGADDLLRVDVDRLDADAGVQRRRRCAAYHASGLMKMSSGSWLPASTLDSRMRL